MTQKKSEKIGIEVKGLSVHDFLEMSSDIEFLSKISVSEANSRQIWV